MDCNIRKGNTEKYLHQTFIQTKNFQGLCTVYLKNPIFFLGQNIFLLSMFSIFSQWCEFCALPPYGTQKPKSLRFQTKQQLPFNVPATPIPDWYQTCWLEVLGHCVCNPMSLSQVFIVKLSLNIFIRELNPINMSQPKNIQRYSHLVSKQNVCL